MLKKAINIIIILLLTAAVNIPVCALETDDLSAASAVLYFPAGDEVLFEKDAYSRRSMASTTKIMTSLLALEQTSPFIRTVITDEMVNVEGTSSGLRAGDIITLDDLVYCMLLESGNDAANAVALTLADSFSDFALMMNKRAAEIGMHDTCFVTPSGLDDENHYTTAYDMALLTAEALRNDYFVSICSQKKYTVDFISSDKTVTLYNHNRLLESYDGCIGVKTGFTKKSGRCLVSAAERNGVVLVAVTLNAGDDWNDHAKMLDYGFSVISEKAIDCDFSSLSVPVTGGVSESVSVCGAERKVFVSDTHKEITRKLYLEKFVYAPVKKGSIIGYAEYICDGRVIEKVPLTASADIEKKEHKNIFDRILFLFDSWWKNG